MPKGQVTDLITDQEMLFARLVLSGTMTDRQAAEAAGLDPGAAAYTKSKPRVRAYMLEYRAAVQAQLTQQEADLSGLAEEELRRQSICRERVLARLWEIAGLSTEATRNTVTGQMKALALIVAIQGLIPDRKPRPSAPPPLNPDIVVSPGMNEQQEPAIPDPPPAPNTPPAAPSPAPASNKSNEYNFAYLSEILAASVLDPTAVFSTKQRNPASSATNRPK